MTMKKKDILSKKLGKETFQKCIHFLTFSKTFEANVKVKFWRND
jgi:hypothetical protein